MKTLKKYLSPDIQSIRLDNEISLILSSLDEPAFGPGEIVMNQTPDYFNHNSIV